MALGGEGHYSAHHSCEAAGKDHIKSVHVKTNGVAPPLCQAPGMREEEGRVRRPQGSRDGLCQIPERGLGAMSGGTWGPFFRRDCVAFRLGTSVLALLCSDPKAIAVNAETPRSLPEVGRKKNKNKKNTAFPFRD